MFAPTTKNNWGAILGAKARKTQDHQTSCRYNFGSINLQVHELEAAFIECTGQMLIECTALISS